LNLRFLLNLRIFASPYYILTMIICAYVLDAPECKTDFEMDFGSMSSQCKIDLMHWYLGLFATWQWQENHQPVF